MIDGVRVTFQEVLGRLSRPLGLASADVHAVWGQSSHYGLPSERLQIGGDRYTASKPYMRLPGRLKPIAVSILQQSDLLLTRALQDLCDPEVYAVVAVLRRKRSQSDGIASGLLSAQHLQKVFLRYTSRIR